MTELSFLIELLLNHKLPKVTRDLIAARLKEVEEGYKSHTVPYTIPGSIPHTILSQPHFTITSGSKGPVQCASTQAILARNPDLVVTPVAQVAQTQATAAAMNSRNQAIAESMAGKVDKTTGRPRKF